MTKKAWKYFKQLEYLGIQPGTSYLDSKKIRMLNLITLACIPLTLYFSIVNWLDDRPILALINISNCITSFIVLILQYRNRNAKARFALSTFNFLFFALGGYFFNNGGQYLLMTVLIVVILAYDKRWIQIGASIVILSTMLLVTFYPSPLFQDQYVPKDRIVTNFLTAFTFIVFIILFFKDIHYTYEDKIEEQHNKLKEMNGTMENILSIIAHDIKSPLISVQDMLSLFQRDMITKETTEENVSLINNRIVLLNAALDNLLQWGVRNINGIKTQQQEACFSSIIQEAIQSQLPQAEQKNITLLQDIDKDLNAYIDRSQILIVLRNIISNAIKYSFFGESIRISAKEIAKQIVVVVEDNGAGMTKEKVNLLFESPQVPTLGTDGERGSGLGLLLCKELLSRNGGSFSITSQPNTGTTFTISLPIKNFHQDIHTAQIQQ